MTDLELGIVAGICTSIVVAVAGTYFNKVIIPWYGRISYSGVRLDGKWESYKKKEDHTENLCLEIKQSGNKVKATMKITLDQHEGGVTNKEYKMTGIIENRLLTLQGKNVDSTQIGVDVALLEVKNGDKMAGYDTWYSVLYAKVDSGSVEWKRVLR